MNRHTKFSFAIATLAAIFAVVFSTTAEAAHTFSGLDLRSGTESSFVREDKEHKATVLIFLSSKCPCSMSHLEEVKNLAKENPEIRFIGVNSNSDETVEDSKKYFAAQGIPFPVLKDEKAVLADEFKAVKTPHAYILDSTGKKLYQGGVSNSAMFPKADRPYLREALSDLKAGREIKTPLARALGCAILR